MSIATDDVDLERDRRLVQQCQAGRAEAFDELYALYHRRLVRHCARRLGSHANAEDVAQEAFIRAWRAIGHFEGRRRFYPWLHVIASNACTDVLRRERPTTSLSELGGAAEPDAGQGIEELFATSIDASVAGEAMQMLNERHRRVLYLREELEWSVQDIAAHEGLEPNAIDSLLWRARASLRRTFHRLSEGAAAVIALGTTRFLSVRHRLARVVDEPSRISLPVRATVTAVIVIGASASSASLLMPPAAHQQAGAGGRTVADVVIRARPTAVAPGGTARSGAMSVLAPTSVGPVGAAGSTSIGRDEQPVVPAGSDTHAVPGAVPSSTGTADADFPPVAIAPLGAVADAAGAAHSVAATVPVIVGGVATDAGGVATDAVGAVQATVGGSLPLPVHQPTTGGGSGIGLPLP